MNKTWRIVLLLGGMVLAFGIMGIVGNSSRASRTLERYKAELRAKGEQLTFAELTRSRIAPTNDLLARLTNAVARIGNQALSPASLEMRKYVGPGQAQVTWQQENPFPANFRAAAAGANWQVFGTQLTDLVQPMAAIRLALQDPTPDAGLRTNLAIRRSVRSC